MKKIDITQFAEEIGVQFNNQELLKSALTHRSFLNESSDLNTSNNERLEFLGDAVLELIISKYLFDTYPERPEGELTSFRAAIVKTESLALSSREMNVGNYLFMSKGEEATGGRDKDYLLANAFEAILGAIYIDKGYEECEIFVTKWLIPRIDTIVNQRLDIDSKTKFQEIAQSLLKRTPEYRLVSEEGPDHEKIFTMSVVVNGKVYGEGKGSSKQRAEEEAASNGLKKLLKMDKSVSVA